MATPRQRILQAAEQLHRDEGLGALSVRRVAERVGLTPMAIYRHYEDKDALVDALVERGFARWEEYLGRALDKRNPMKRLKRALMAYLEFALAEPRSFELMFLTPRPHLRRAPASLAMTTSPSFAAVSAAMKEAMDEGLVRRGDPADTILLTWAAAHGLIALHFTGRFAHDDTRFRQLYDDRVSDLLRLLATDAPKSKR